MLFKSLRTWILAICMSILLVITPLLYFSFNLNFYKEHLPQSTNEQQTLVQNIQQFLFYKETSNLDITSEEYSHMLDVQTIFQKVLLTEAIAFLLFLLIIFSFYGHRGNHAILLGIHR
ncbi:TPA: hypothetical protein DEP21_06080 [Patescibacteria group bacterium]|nr:hypothetical protein [Candidatus Gracilibacteria bacterium]